MVDSILIAGYLEADDYRFIVFGGYLKGDSIHQAVDVIRLVFLFYYFDVFWNYDIRIEIAYSEQ